jgi:hypothetical protein
VSGRPCSQWHSFSLSPSSGLRAHNFMGGGASSDCKFTHQTTKLLFLLCKFTDQTPKLLFPHCEFTDRKHRSYCAKHQFKPSIYCFCSRPLAGSARTTSWGGGGLAWTVNSPTKHPSYCFRTSNSPTKHPNCYFCSRLDCEFTDQTPKLLFSLSPGCGLRVHNFIGGGASLDCEFTDQTPILLFLLLCVAYEWPRWCLSCTSLVHTV